MGGNLDIDKVLPICRYDGDGFLIASSFNIEELEKLGPDKKLELFNLIEHMIRPIVFVTI